MEETKFIHKESGHTLTEAELAFKANVLATKMRQARGEVSRIDLDKLYKGSNDRPILRQNGLPFRKDD